MEVGSPGAVLLVADSTHLCRGSGCGMVSGSSWGRTREVDWSKCRDGERNSHACRRCNPALYPA
jgi:hypothetical protein